MTDTLYPTVDAAQIDSTDVPRLIWVPEQDALGLLWIDNPKIHEDDSIRLSFTTHGFQELPKLDANLPNKSGTNGAIKAGNGRVEVLAEMERDGAAIPRGIGIDDQGRWCMPIIAGVDAQNEAMARAYAIDSNNLTLANASAQEKAALWDPVQYLRLLEKQDLENALPVTVTHDDVKELLEAAQGKKKDEPKAGRLTISPELLERHDYLLIVVDNELDWNVLIDLFEVDTVLSAKVGTKTLQQKGLGRVIRASKLFEVVGLHQPSKDTPDTPDAPGVH